MALTEGTENTEQNKNLTDAELRNMVTNLSKQVEDLKAQKVNAGPVFNADDIAKLIKASKESDKEIDYAGGIQEEQIPVEDWDEKGVRFCAPFVGYCIVDDVRKGQRVRLPYNKEKIFFDYGATRRMSQGKYEGVAVYSAYTSHSKKEIAWLRNHRYYNIYFYESTTQAMNTDAMKAQRIGRIMSVLSNYEMDALLKRCKEYDVPMGEDAAIMRSHLAMKMMEREIAEEIESTKKQLSDAYKAQLLLEGKE